MDVKGPCVHEGIRKWIGVFVLVAMPWPAAWRASTAHAEAPTPTAEAGTTADKAGSEAAPENPSRASPPVRVLTREELIARQFETMADQYTLHLKSPDWITRSVAVISLSRLPTQEATEAILQRLEGEAKPVGQLVAWQAMLGRARLLTEEQHQAWMTATWKMIRKDLFHGDLRIGLLEMLSASPASRDARDWFKSLFDRTSSQDSSDIPTLIAMGRALRAWGDKPMVEQMLGALSDPNTAIRAELILQAAGAGVAWNQTPQAKRAYEDWWKAHKDTFAAGAPAEPAWKELRPQFIAAPVAPASVDPTDPQWRRELELGLLELRQYDFAIALDCSRSMRPEIERLKRDLRVMFLAFTTIAREPRVGITLFAPGKIVKPLPLTGDLGTLVNFVNGAGIMGPPGEEEWSGALAQTITGSRWVPPGQYSRRVIVLISDEPITDPQFAAAKPLAKDAGKAGFRIYGVMISSLENTPNNPLSVPFDRTASATVSEEDQKRGKGGKGGSSWSYYDDIASATDARAISVAVPQGLFGLGLSPEAALTQKHTGKKDNPHSPVAIAPIYPGGGPTNRILTMVLVDAINPQYADRVEPFVKILVAYCQMAATRVPEKRTWGPPDKMEPNLR